MKCIIFKQQAKDLVKVFFPTTLSEKYRYLGYIHNPYCNATTAEGYMARELVWNFVRLLDSKAKSWWTPRWFLRFLHLYGNDNSVARVRSRTLHNLHRKLTKSLFIVDMKTKWSIDGIRIYGYFDDECNQRLRYMEEVIYSLYNNKKKK